MLDSLKNILRIALRTYLFLLSAFFSLLSWIFLTLHFSKIYYGNNFMWIFWILSVLFLFLSVFPKEINLKKYLTINNKTLLLGGVVILVYFSTHLYNFNHAPWNSYGLFDDAAWDVYYAKLHAFKAPFQAAFFDQVGFISREVVFHYYITIFFVLFGYNLLVFNISLLFLGFITVLFTVLLIHKLFNNWVVTIISLLIINFFPLHFMHIFMGHRYAITAPLMTVSLFFLYRAFSKNSFFSAAVSSLFAALCWDSAIMGKQFLYGLFAACIAILIFDKRARTKEKISLGIFWTLSFIIAAVPLITYILFNYSDYSLREKGLISDFFNLYRNAGVVALKPFWDQLYEIFFAKISFRRQFLQGFYAIPLSYYPPLILGSVIAFIRKRFELLALALIPIAGSFVSGSYDFRVLIGVPVWVILISYSLNFIFGKETKNVFTKYTLYLFILIIIAAGLIPSIKYIYKTAVNPNSFYLLPHKDIAVARLTQDIVAGEKNPNYKMKPDELNRKVNEVPYDTFVSPESAYAIMHLYLKDFDDKKILSFIDGRIQMLKTPEEIFNDNKNAIANYIPKGKDLKLVWEISSKSSGIIQMFKEFAKFGKEETFSGNVDGNKFSLYVLTISGENLKIFKDEISKLQYQ